MTQQVAVFPLILLGVVLNAGAQLLLKVGVDRIGHINFTMEKLLATTYQLALNPYIFMGLCFYVISVIVWLLVLSRVEVSYAYPMVSLGYVLNAVAAYYWLGEDLTPLRISGIMIILFGVYLIARS
ncbi:MAG: EamA family transporter [Desulfovibrio sp.]